MITFIVGVGAFVLGLIIGPDRAKSGISWARDWVAAKLKKE